MLNIFKKKGKDYILGIDLNPNYIAIAEILSEKGTYKLNNYAYKPLVGGWMTEEFVKEEEQLGQFIANIINDERIKTKKSAISLPTQTVMRKSFEVDKKMKDREIENVILYTGKKYISHNIDEVYFDFKVISEENEKNPENKDVLIVASKKKNITTREDTLIISGLEPKIVDVEQYAMERGLSLIQYQIKKELDIDLKEKEKNALVFIDISETKIRLDLYVNNKFGYSIEESISDIYSTVLSNKNSGLRLKNKSLNESEKEVLSDIDSSAYTETQLKTFQIIKKLMNKVKYTFLTEDSDLIIDAIVLKGLNEKIDDITPILNENLEYPTIKANPTLSFDIAEHINLIDLEKTASNLLLACCLGIREENK